MLMTAQTTLTNEIYRGRPARPIVGTFYRVVCFGLGLSSLVVLVLAARLTPSPSGVGSHRGLGLASCQMLERTGIPCPGCGMTTSFAWFVRGNLVASLYVQPMGALLALATAAMVWGGLYVAVTGRPVYRLLLIFPSRVYLVGFIGLAIAAWAWKIFLELRGLDGWR